jgi:hypothetical protein
MDASSETFASAMPGEDDRIETWQHLENQAALPRQIVLSGRTGQPLIARMVSRFPIHRFMIPQMFSNPCKSMSARRGMTSAKVTPSRPIIGRTGKTKTIETEQYETHQNSHSQIRRGCALCPLT